MLQVNENKTSLCEKFKSCMLNTSDSMQRRASESSLSWFIVLRLGFLMNFSWENDLSVLQFVITSVRKIRRIISKLGNTDFILSLIIMSYISEWETVFSALILLFKYIWNCCNSVLNSIYILGIIWHKVFTTCTAILKWQFSVC